jgi:2'-5' RNA ligase
MKSFKEYIMESASQKKGNGFGCLMLMYNSDFKSKFTELTRQINKSHLYNPDDGFGTEDDPHITVKYGLHEQDHEKVFDILGKLDPIEVKLRTKVSLFENEKFDVIKIDIVSEEIRALNKRVCRLFDYTDKFKDYHPHTTVAYVESGLGCRYLNLESPLLGSTFSLNRICFSDEESNKKYRYLK